MNNTTERCQQLHTIHDRLKEEVRNLDADGREEEYDGVDNPFEMVSIIKSQ